MLLLLIYQQNDSFNAINDLWSVKLCFIPKWTKFVNMTFKFSFINYHVSCTQFLCFRYHYNVTMIFLILLWIWPWVSFRNHNNVTLTSQYYKWVWPWPFRHNNRCDLDLSGIIIDVFSFLNTKYDYDLDLWDTIVKVTLIF